MKTPGPDHPITIEPARSRWRAKLADVVIAETREALILREANYKPVVYFPRGDVDMTRLKRTAHATYCAYKGDAAYFSVAADARLAENAVWTYEKPYPAMVEIAGRLAFYPNLVEVSEVENQVPEPPQ